ncbi:MAG: winged helix DNA-binding domain-containing protein, partial [Actinomycetota bacterium]|nr:winged helix DNA-binding domain-containing protein [Actinomycetota bacterium]
AHLIGYAAMRGVVCRGPEAAHDEPTYVLFEDWAPPARVRDPDAALAELTRRYLRAYGPAAPEDLAAWAGVGLRRARRGWGLVADELDASDAAGATVWRLRGREDRGRDAKSLGEVRLLGAWDAYLLGYRHRALVVDERFARRLRPGGGIIRPAILVDGRVVATWRPGRARGTVTVSVAPFEDEPAPREALEAQVADLGRFLGVQTRLRLEA